MYILGFSCYYHDAAACLIRDGQVVAAAEEERFTRKKHDASFPVNAIEYCLFSEGIVAGEIDAVCYHEQPLTKFRRIIERHILHYPWSYRHFRIALPRWFGEIFPLRSILAKRLRLNQPLNYFPHHLSHAACTFYSSNFDQAAILVVDAVGEDSSTSWGTGEGTTIQHVQKIPYPHSLGILYTTITALLGFPVMEGEGRVMALAAFGEPVYYDGLRHIATCYDDGSIQLRPEYFAIDYASRMMSPRLESYYFPMRKPEEPLEQKHCDMAASIQAFLEERMLCMGRYVREKSGMDKICLAGGVALNSVANGQLQREEIFREVFIPPAPGDSGASLGAALLHYYSNSGAKRQEIPFASSFGTEYTQREIENFLTLKEIPHERYSEEELYGVVTAALQINKIVGWFQGRMEFGPRALGNRSILANPAKADNKDLLNARVKGREEFRPFGASVLEEDAREYFLDSVRSPFMQMVFPVRPEIVEKIPAVVHRDGSCRVQTVPRDAGNPFRKLLETWREQTGLSLLLNTSFNLAGEPIVSNPREAYECFAGSGMDMLVLGNCVLSDKMERGLISDG